MDRDTFFASATKAKVKGITLDDGSSWFIKKLSQAEVEVMGKRYANNAAAAEGLRWVVMKCVINEDGTRFFSDDDMNKLALVDFDIIKQLAGEITDYSGIKTKDESPKKD